MVLDDKDKRIKELEKENLKLKKENEKFTSKKANKVKKKPSAYNTFMSKEIPIIKKNDPSLSHTEAFKQAVENWKAKGQN